MNTDGKPVFEARRSVRSAKQMTIDEAETELAAICELSHGPTCAMRLLASAECSCGKIDRLIELEDRIGIRAQSAGNSEGSAINQLSADQIEAAIQPANSVTTVVIRQNAKPQKLVFADADRSYVLVVTPQDLIDAGVPIHRDTGGDLEFLGATEDQVPTGRIDPVALTYD
jgi:hypothetical protein